MMIKDKFKEIVKSGIHPSLKKAGFKKSGNHFLKRLEETQQVVTLQLSRGNTHDKLRFYFRFGILINGMKPDSRELKSEVYADYRFSLVQVTDDYDKLQYDITIDSPVKSIAENYKQLIESDLIPFFKKLEKEDDCIEFIISQDSLQGSIEFIKYLCKTNKKEYLEQYVVRLTKFLKKIKDQYNDPNTARNRVDRMLLLINEHGNLTSELKDKIEKSW